MRIRVYTDDPKLGAVVAKGLTAKGYAVDTLHDGAEAEKRLLVHGKDYDLVVLDLMLPSRSGLEICTAVREKGVTVPILVLTARAETDHKVELLTAGADDYVVKPFSFKELVARIEAILRRPNEALPSVLEVGVFKLNPTTHEAWQEDTPLELTLKELRLLEYFMRHPNQVVDREDLLTHLWDFNYEAFSNIVDVHIKNLRKKLDREDEPSVLETIRGVGYRFRA